MYLLKSSPSTHDTISCGMEKRPQTTSHPVFVPLPRAVNTLRIKGGIFIHPLILCQPVACLGHW